MTRSFKAPKEYIKHDYLPHSSESSSSKGKKEGAGRFQLGSDKEFIKGELERFEYERDEDSKDKLDQRKKDEAAKKFEEIEKVIRERANSTTSSEDSNSNSV